MDNKSDTRTILTHNENNQFDPSIPVRKRRIGSGFTNLQSLMNANKGAGQVMAGAVSNVATQAKDQAQQQRGSTTDAFEQETGAAKDKAQKAIANAGKVLNYGTGALPSDDQVKEAAENFKTQGEYKGPTQIQNVQPIMNLAQQAQQLGQNLMNNDARQGILGTVYGGRGRYGRGFASLDNLLTQKEGAQTLLDASNATRNLTQDIGKKLNTTEAQALQAQQDIANQRRAFVKNTDTELSDILTAAEKERDARNLAIFGSDGRGGLQGLINRGINNSLDANYISNFEYNGLKGQEAITALFNDLPKFGVDLTGDMTRDGAVPSNVRASGDGKFYVDPNSGLNFWQVLGTRLGTPVQQQGLKLSEDAAKRSALLSRFMRGAELNSTRQERPEDLLGLKNTDTDIFRPEMQNRDAFKSQEQRALADLNKQQSAKTARDDARAKLENWYNTNADRINLANRRLGGTASIEDIYNDELLHGRGTVVEPLDEYKQQSINTQLEALRNIMRTAGYGGERGWRLADLDWSRGNLNNANLNKAYQDQLNQQQNRLNSGYMSITDILNKLK